MITPGPVVITVAFIGYLVAGLAGAILAAIGVFLPLYLITVLFAPHFHRVAQNRQVKAFLDGVTAPATRAIPGAAGVLRRPAPPATERTVVKVAHDAGALYIVVRCYDSNMRGVRASQLRRDADLSSDDNVQLLIDSFDDRRSAFVFATNPNGALWDAQFSGVDDVNENWNGLWEVAVSRDSAGWTAEFRIPLLALRFHAGTNPEFGFNVRRFIRRKNEEDLWRSYGRAQGFYRLNNEGAITDLGDLRRPHDLELYPYALGRAVETEHDSIGGETTGGCFGGKGGVDAKLGITPTLTADVTVSTDFAQVEADQQVVNLTRFPFFFPEKRQFFLESSGQLDLGTPGRVQLFYSRRIGLDTSGAPVPILAGGRLYGRLGPWRIGVL